MALRGRRARSVLSDLSAVRLALPSTAKLNIETYWKHKKYLSTVELIRICMPFLISTVQNWSELVRNDQNWYPSLLTISRASDQLMILWWSYDHKIIIWWWSSDDLLIILWSSYDHLMIILWSSYDHLMIILWSSYDHLMIILWSSYDHLMIILWSTYDPVMILWS